MPIRAPQSATQTAAYPNWWPQCWALCVRTSVSQIPWPGHYLRAHVRRPWNRHNWHSILSRSQPSSPGICSPFTLGSEPTSFKKIAQYPSNCQVEVGQYQTSNDTAYKLVYKNEVSICDETFPSQRNLAYRLLS